MNRSTLSFAACALAIVAAASAQTARAGKGPTSPAHDKPTKADLPAPPAALPAELTLHRAAADGDLELAKRMVARGDNINAVEPARGDTPLLVAMRRNNDREAEQYRKQLAVAAFLLDSGADVNAKNIEGETALHYGAHWGQDGLITRLKDLGGDIAAVDAHGRLPIHYAAENGHVESAKLVTVRPVLMSKLDNDENAPFDLAVANDWRDVAFYLLGAGARVAESPDRMQRRVDLCAKKGWDDVLDRMFERLANKPEDRRQLLDRAYNIAFANGNTKLTEHLADVGANSEGESSTGFSKLFVAADLGHEGVLKRMLDTGANPSTPERGSGWTPLHAAAMNSKLQIVRDLLDKNADPNAPDGLGRTPLHIAAIAANPAVAAELMKAGADPARTDDQGNSPLHYAARAGTLPLARALIDAHAAQKPNAGGLMPYDLADEHPEIQAILQRAPVIAERPLPKGFDEFVKLIAPENTPESIAATREQWAVPASQGTPLLILAVQAGSLRAVKKLLDEQPGSLSERDAAGLLAIHCAAEARDAEILREVIARGAPVNDSKNPTKWTPLHFAAAAGNAPAIKLLVEKGADRKATDSIGRIPSDVAAQAGQAASLAALQ